MFRKHHLESGHLSEEKAREVVFHQGQGGGGALLRAPAMPRDPGAAAVRSSPEERGPSDHVPVL